MHVLIALRVAGHLPKDDQVTDWPVTYEVACFQSATGQKGK